MQTCGVGGDADKCREWLAEESCPDGQNCSAGRCREGCVNECGEVGVKQCNGDGVQECIQIDADDCLHWGEITACEAGESCSNGKCSDTCTNECEAESQRCAVEGFETCGQFDADECLEWSEVTKCQNEQVCSNGVCGDVCLNECGPEGQRDCTGAGFRLCGNADEDECLEWGQETACDEGETCSNGRCAVGCINECAEASKQCAGEGAGLQSCGQFDEDACLEWSDIVACDLNETCSNGVCDVGCVNECALNSRQCAGAGFQVCGNHDEDACLEWGVETACQGGTVCSAGQCLEQCINECAPDSAQCVGAGVQTCGEFDGDDCTDWGAVVPCAEGQSCSGGVCSIVCGDECLNGANRCAPGGVQGCGNHDDDECTEWGAAAPCPGEEVCSNGECAAQCVDECGRGALRCSANGVETCGQFDADDCAEWGAPAPCPAGEICSNGACAVNCSNECAAGSVQCAGNGFQSCGDHDDDACLEWSGIVGCQDGTSCSGGVCTRFCANECEGQATRCGPGGLQNCGQFDGDDCLEWSPGAPCPEGGVCDAGACAQVCNDECMAGVLDCDGASVIECGNFDADGCSEWSLGIPCADGEVCNGGACDVFDAGCEGDIDCPGGFICAFGVCVEAQACMGDEDCAAGETCDPLTGQCRPGEEGRVGNPCGGDADCGINLLCSAPELGGYCTNFCDEETPCPLGSTCYQVDPEDPELAFCFRDCADLGQCEANHACYETGGPLGGACYFAQCQEDADCPAEDGAIVACEAGQCVAQNACDPVMDEGCAEGESCIQTDAGPLCLTECIMFEDGCPGGSRCVSTDLELNGVCLPAGVGGVGDPCNSHADCDENTICVDDGLGATSCRAQCDIELDIDCEAPEVCLSLGGRAGICVIDCDSDCNPGDARCTDAGIEFCEQIDEDLCLEWGGNVACGGGMSCNELTLECELQCAADADCMHPLVPASCVGGRCVIQSECDPATGEGCAEIEECFLANADGSAGVCLEGCDPVGPPPRCSNEADGCGFFGGGDFCISPGPGQSGDFCESSADCAAGLGCFNTPSGGTACFGLCNAMEGEACPGDGEICNDLGLDGRIGVCFEPCEDQCVEGSQQCSEDGGLQTCVFEGNALCLDWDAGIPCGDGMRCDPEIQGCRISCEADIDCLVDDGVPRVCEVATGNCDVPTCVVGGGGAECPGDNPVCVVTEFDADGQPVGDGLCLAGCNALLGQDTCGVEGKCDALPVSDAVAEWACVPTLGLGLGEECEDIVSCAPGLTCMGTVEGNSICAQICGAELACQVGDCVEIEWYPEAGAGVCDG